ncbi:MAG: 50S ribosomal protein L25 [Treponema sp.]|jgi:large subunit ribosomal protein L25|nr:50S ribosomal protein L25 [Treponema sp.]
MSQVVLAARSRAGRGSAEARRIRRSGRIPAVLYGRGGTSVAIDLDEREFSNRVKNISESTIVKVEVEGKTYDAFVKDTQRSITAGSILHVDFYEVESGVALRARVSLHLVGNPVGVREGGVLESPLHEIEVECLPKDLPERIEVDIGELKVNQSLHVRDLNLGEGVRLISGGDQVVALVKYAREEAAAPAADETAAAAAAAAVPAAGAAPAAKAQS